MSAPNPVQPQGAAPKKTSPWLFVLIGCGGIIVLGGLIMAGLGFFAVQKAKEIGLDPDLLSEKPALAAAKMIAAANPDVEIVDVDEDGERITFRDKSTGKTVTLDLEDVKRGRISFEGEDGEEVVLQAEGEGDNGRINIQSSQGSYQLGGASEVDMPGWLPLYPGGEAQGVMRSQTPEGRTGSVAVTTNDSVEQVMQFYKEALESAGLEVSTMQTGGAGGAGAVVTGESPGGARGAMVMIGSEDGRTTASVTYNEKD